MGECSLNSLDAIHNVFFLVGIITFLCMGAKVIFVANVFFIKNE